MAAAVAVTGLLLPGIAPSWDGRPTDATTGERQQVTAQTHRVPDVPVPATARRDAAGSAPTVTARLGAATVAPFTMVGVTWSDGSDHVRLRVQVRTRTYDGWTGWQPLAVDHDGPGPAHETRSGTTATWVGHADGVAVRVLAPPHQAPQDVEVVTLDGGAGLAGPPLQSVAAETATGVPPRPTVVTRAQWGVDSSTQVRCASPTTSATMSGVVLHHTAGSNDYTAAEAPGIVRAVHRYHTASRGWCDVGYNFFVDNYGVVYEGRRGGIDLQVRGAHAGNQDVNLLTTGVAMMGNFEKVDVPAATRASVVDLLAWRLASFGHNATDTMTFDGITLPAVSGHRDIHASGIRPATATACPGLYGDAWLDGTLRAEVQQVIDAYAAQAPDPAPTVTRIAGADRFATAAAVAASSFTGTGGVVFLASGTAFPDALAAGPAAARQVAPVLLTRPDRLPEATAAALQRLAPSRVYLAGGESAISASVAAQVRSYAGEVVRLAGTDRYATGAAVTAQFWSTSPVVYLASGIEYADALSGGALAARVSAPVLLAPPGRLPDEVAGQLTALAPQRVVLLGGPAALSEPVLSAVRDSVPSAQVTRLAGLDRYATSAAVARAGWGSAPEAFLATGIAFPDALAAVPAAAAAGAPLLLTRPACLAGSVADTLTALGSDTRTLLGGPGALQDAAGLTRCAG